MCLGLSHLISLVVFFILFLLPVVGAVIGRLFYFSGWLELWVVGLAVVGLWGLFGWGDLVVQLFYLVRVVIKGGHCA